MSARKLYLYESIIVLILLVISIFSFQSCKKEAPTDAPEIITKITGKISDSQTHQAIAGVQITTNPVTSSIVTGTDGNYTIPNINPGQFTITAKKEGYQDNSVVVNVSEGKTVNADIKLQQLQPALEISHNILDFEVSENNLTFSIYNKTKIGSIDWQISKDNTWLTVAPISGSVSVETDIISVSVDRTQLNYGNHSGVINISSNSGSKKINVIVVKPNPNAPQLSVMPIELDFDSIKTTLQLTIKNTGANVLNWSASPNANWLSLSSTSGSIIGGSPTIVNVTVNRLTLSPANYYGSINITSNGGDISISVYMTVTPSSQNFGPYTPDANTLILYHFDEASGNDVYDATMWKHDAGTIYTIVDNGKFSKGRRFGISEQFYVGILTCYFPNPSPLNFGLDKFTIEGWVYLNEYSGEDFVKLYNGSLVISLWSKDIGIFVQNETGLYEAFSIENVLNVYEWIHIALSYDGGKLRVFVNGQQKAEKSFSGRISGPTSRYLEIAGRNTIIDEFRISDKARAVNEFNLSKRLNSKEAPWLIKR